MVNCVYVTEHCSFVSTYFAAWESERCRAAATMLGRMVASRNYPQTGFEEINLQTAFSQISPKPTSGESEGRTAIKAFRKRGFSLR